MADSDFSFSFEGPSVPTTTSPLRVKPKPSRPRSPNSYAHHSLLLPTAVARRQSSSFKHLKQNSLVSRSPFKSGSLSNTVQKPPLSPQPKYPSSLSAGSPGSSHTHVYSPPHNLTRRVSGEKRPRPDSMHEQAEAENIRAFAFKRERRQSRSFQGLLEKSPVSSSPFRGEADDTDVIKRTSTPPSTVDVGVSESVNEAAASTKLDAPANPDKNLSPARSSLISRRLHGPRASNESSTGKPSNNRRVRRKTVTFDERCDVVEFEREDEEVGDGNVFESDEDSDVIERSSCSESQGASNDEGDYKLLNPTSFSRSGEEGNDLLDHAQNLLRNLDALTDDTDTDGELSFASEQGQDQESARALSRRHNDSFEQHGNEEQLTSRDPPCLDIMFNCIEPPSPRGQIPQANSEDIVPFLPRPSLQLSLGLDLGIGSGLGIVSDADDDEGVRRNDASEDVDPPSLHKAVDNEHVNHREPAPNDKEKDSDESTSYSYCEDAEVYALLNGDRPVDSPSTPPPLSRSNARSRSNSSPLQPNTRLGSSRSPARVSSFVPNNLVRSPPSTRPRAMSSPRVSPGVGTLDGDSLLRAHLPAGKVLESPTQGLRTRPRIDRDRVKRGLNKAKGFNKIDRDRDGEEALNHAEDLSQTLDEGEDVHETDAGGACNSAEDHRDIFPSLSSSSVAESVEAAFETPQKFAVQTFDDSSKESLEQENLLSDRALEVNLDSRDADSPRPVMPARAATDTDIATGLVQFGLGLPFDLGGGFTLGFGQEMSLDNHKDDARGIGVQLGDVRSALDRLLDDVAGTNGVQELKDKVESNDSVRRDQERVDSAPASPKTTPASSAPAQRSLTPTTSQPNPPERSGIDSAILKGVVPPSSEDNIAPPVPPKDARTKREQLILEKRRLVRKIEDGGTFIDPPRLEVHFGEKVSGRPLRRRSRSTGDVGDSQESLAVADWGLGKSIEKELKRLEQEDPKGKYHVRERKGIIYASSDNRRRDHDNVAHVNSAGDVDRGKAWKMVRRPSDINEHSKQIRELRLQEKIGNAHGKVFVKVLNIKGVDVPLPPQPTAITCTLNNGIHYVTTPECKFTPDCKIDQEFELIEHSKLEFTLTIKVRRDTHIISQFKALSAPTPPPAQVQAPISKSSGVRGFFSSSPKPKAKPTRHSSTPAPSAVPEILARYLKPDGTLARAFVCFREVASHCETKLFEIAYPLIGQKMEADGTLKTMEVGEIILQMFRLPPLPGIPPEKLPQSLDECQRGLRHTKWHKATYFEGVLTQNGGDCMTWRRRHFRVIGAGLIAFNHVTRKAIAKIDLSKALAVEDDQDRRSLSRTSDEYCGLYGVERSFRLTFPEQQEISFFADTDNEKAKWLQVFRALIGQIPPNPLWAELLWQRQEDFAKQAGTADGSNSQSP